MDYFYDLRKHKNYIKNNLDINHLSISILRDKNSILKSIYTKDDYVYITDKDSIILLLLKYSFEVYNKNIESYNNLVNEIREFSIKYIYKECVYTQNCFFIRNKYKLKYKKFNFEVEYDIKKLLNKNKKYIDLSNSKYIINLYKLLLKHGYSNIYLHKLEMALRYNRYNINDYINLYNYVQNLLECMKFPLELDNNYKQSFIKKNIYSNHMTLKLEHSIFNKILYYGNL